MSKPLRRKKIGRSVRPLSIQSAYELANRVEGATEEIEQATRSAAATARAIKDKIVMQYRAQVMAMGNSSLVNERPCLHCGQPKRHNNSYCSSGCAKSHREQSRQ